MLIGYARVSTDEQELDLQRQALSLAGCVRIFEEKASGAARDRPELTRALEFMREDDSLVVWRLDRLARSLKQLIETVEQFDCRKTHLRSLTENLDTSTPSGRLTFHIFGALAEFERGLIRERTMAGLAAARKLGRVGGRPRIITDKQLKAAKALLKTGQFSVGDVAKQIGASSSTLYRYIPAAKTVSRA